MSTNVTVQSNSISIFPSSHRGVNTSQYGTNFITEYNLSSIINKLLYSGSNGKSKNGFLITDVDATSPTEIEFNIGGYFVSVNTSDLISCLNKNASSQGMFEDFVTFSVDDSSHIVSATANIATEVNQEKLEDPYRYMVGSDFNGNTPPKTDSNVNATTITLDLFKVSGTPSNYVFESMCNDSKLQLNNFLIDGGIIS